MIVSVWQMFSPPPGPALPACHHRAPYRRRLRAPWMKTAACLHQKWGWLTTTASQTWSWYYSWKRLIMFPVFLLDLIEHQPTFIICLDMKEQNGVLIVCTFVYVPVSSWERQNLSASLTPVHLDNQFLSFWVSLLTAEAGWESKKSAALDTNTIIWLPTKSFKIVQLDFNFTSWVAEHIILL